MRTFRAAIRVSVASVDTPRDNAMARRSASVIEVRCPKLAPTDSSSADRNCAITMYTWPMVCTGASSHRTQTRVTGVVHQSQRGKPTTSRRVFEQHTCDSYSSLNNATVYSYQGQSMRKEGRDRQSRRDPKRAPENQNTVSLKKRTFPRRRGLLYHGPAASHRSRPIQADNVVHKIDKCR